MTSQVLSELHGHLIFALEVRFPNDHVIVEVTPEQVRFLNDERQELTSFSRDVFNDIIRAADEIPQE